MESLANATLIGNPVQKPKNLGFGGQFSLGYLTTHSSSSTTSLNSELKLGYNTPLWEHRLDLQATSASTDGQTTAEQYFGAAQSNRLLSKRSYLFGYLGYIYDRFSGYRYQTSAVIGYGVGILKTKAQHLKLEIGAGYTRAQTNPDTLGVPANTNTSPAARGSERYSLKFSKTAAINQTLTLEKSNFNLYSQFQIGIQAQLVGNLAFVLSYMAQHNSNVSRGLPQTTTTMSISVQYTLGDIFN